MNRYKDRRKDKRYMNHLIGKLKVGTYVEDCRYHPCLITERTVRKRDIEFSDFQCVSLVNGKPNGCSMYHCGPVPLSREEAYARAEFMQQYGMEEYLRRYQGYTDEDIAHHRELNAVWHFDEQ